MPMLIKGSIAACAVVFALTLSAQSPAAAEPQQVPAACSGGTHFIRNGMPYVHECVGRDSYRRCVRWMPVLCGGGIVNRRS
jgi:hypothetical protein